MTDMRITNVATTIVEAHAQATSRDWSQFDHDLHALIVRTLSAACLAGAEALERTCGTCQFDGACGIQAVCVSSVYLNRRATGCTGGWAPKEDA